MNASIGVLQCHPVVFELTKRSGEQGRRSSRLGDADVGIAEWSVGLMEVKRGRSGAMDPKLAAVRQAGVGTGSAAPESAVPRVADASACGLDVRLGSRFFGGVPVVGKRIQAGQTGAGRQEHQQEEECLGLELREHPVSIAGKA
jgi:hypothetical protein